MKSLNETLARIAENNADKFAYGSRCVRCGQHVIISFPLKLSKELQDQIDGLEAENAKLRALVERAACHIGCSCVECDEVREECKEALKWGMNVVESRRKRKAVGEGDDEG